MRNLIGRLNARSPLDLDRIATAWQISVSAADRSGQVAQLYRALTDIRVVRDAWAVRSAAERALLAALAGASEPLTLDVLAGLVERESADVRATAVALYRSGWLAREGDEDELPIGEDPKLFVPRELAHLIRRVEAEIAAGTSADVPVADLLTRLDDVEIEEAAQRWGMPVIPGLRSRDELIAAILGTIADPDRHAAVVAALDRDAAALFRAVRDGPSEGIALTDAVASAGFDPGARPRIRGALAHLERALLVWHGYRPDGTRVLFVPTEIRAPQPRPAPPIPDAVAIDDDTPLEPHRYELAWDLLTLLRALTAADRPRTRLGDTFPAPWLRRLNRRLWRTGQDLPPDGYVPFLMALALAEGLIVPEEGRAGTPVVTGDIRRWRDRTFADQDAHLRWRWLTAINWIEGSEQADAHIWGGDWRSLRRGLLTAIGELPDADWRPLDTLATWIAEREPGLLGRTFSAAVGQGAVEDGPEGRRAATIAAIALTLRRSFAWLGLVDVRRAATHGFLLRVTPRGRAIATGGPLPDADEPDRLTIGDDAALTLVNPSPLQIWSITAFADQVALGSPATYRLTARSIERAIAAGFQTTQIAAFLRNQTGEALPPSVTALLERERRDHPIVQTRQATLLTAATPEARERLKALLNASGIEAIPAGDGFLVTAESTDPARLIAILRASGFVTRSE